MTASILRADARAIPLPDASVDLIVTSPPYFALRSYTDGGEHYAGQIGAEPTPAEYIASLIECTREWVRVLKPSGSLFVNLGDKYNSAASGQNLKDAAGKDGRGPKRYDAERGSVAAGVRPKSLLMLPERYRIAAVDELGLIARAVLVWSKPNGLPESVTDRVRRSHEDWVHLTKQPRYFSAVDEIREAHVTTDALSRIRTSTYAGPMSGAMNGAGNPLGKLPGSVWEMQGGVWDNEDGSPVRLVLNAVAAGGLSIEEGERLLWDGSRSSGRRSRSATTAAGNGSASSTPEATAGTGGPTSATAEHTGSPTSSPRVPSPTASPSTTSADGGPASTLTTSSPSPSPSTSSAGQGPSPSASTGTPSLPRTPTFDTTDTASARPACGCGCANTDDASELPDSTVWTIATEPLKVPDHLGVDHFAAFPTEWPRRIVQGWSPSGICTACGEGRRPVSHTPSATGVVKRANAAATDAPRGLGATSGLVLSGGPRQKWRAENPAVLTGYECACPDTSAPTRPSVVLDPFGGTGTTALVASVLGRHGISVDMSADYCRLARWRTTDPAQRAKAARVTAPPKQFEGQGDLLDLFGGAA